MRKYLQQNTISAINRQTYTGNKSAYTTVGSGMGYLRPMTETQSSVNALQFGMGNTLFVENDTDIRETDKVTVDGVEYTVRGVSTHPIGAVPYKKCILIRPEKL